MAIFADTGNQRRKLKVRADTTSTSFWLTRDSRENAVSCVGSSARAHHLKHSRSVETALRRDVHAFGHSGNELTIEVVLY